MNEARAGTSGGYAVAAHEMTEVPKPLVTLSKGLGAKERRGYCLSGMGF